MCHGHLAALEYNQICKAREFDLSGSLIHTPHTHTQKSSWLQILNDYPLIKWMDEYTDEFGGDQRKGLLQVSP